MRKILAVVAFMGILMTGISVPASATRVVMPKHGHHLKDQCRNIPGLQTRYDFSGLGIYVKTGKRTCAILPGYALMLQNKRHHHG